MKTESAKEILSGLREAGINFVATLPDSQFTEVLKMVAEDAHFIHFPASNEAIGLAACAGAWFAGRRPALLIPTSGLLVAAWPLTSLCMAFEIPILILIPYRGDIGDRYWWMGPYNFTTEPILNALHVPFKIVSRTGEMKVAILNAQRSATAWLRPAAILLTGEVMW